MSSPDVWSSSAGSATAPSETRDARRSGSTYAAYGLRALVLAVATGFMLVSVLDGQVGTGSGTGFDPEHAGRGDSAEAVARLERSVAAGRELPFTGTLAVHAPGNRAGAWFGADGSSWHAVVSLTNVPGRGVDVQTETAGGSAAVFVAAGDANPIQLESSAVEVLDRAYDLVLGGRDTVAGRAATVVEARRFDGSVAGRFWIDDRTDLLLRREVYDASGEVTRATAFLDVRLDSMAAAFRPLAANLAASASRRVDEREYADLVAEGWTCCPAELAGVLELREVRRLDSTAPTLQLVYSDGLTTASVFQQQGSLVRSALTDFEPRTFGDDVVHVRTGLVTYAVWQAGGVIYTVACDTPYGLASAVAGFPHRATPSNDGTTSLRARLDRGISRMMSWLNPFE